MSNSATKVLILTTAYKPMIGGSEIAIEEVIKRLGDISFDILTPRYQRQYLPLERQANVTIHRVGLGSWLDKVIFPILGAYRASKLMRANQYQAMHVWQASYAGGAGWLIKLFYPQIKLIVTLQEGQDLSRQNILVRFFRKLILMRADQITAISSYLKNYAQRTAPNVSVVIIPNGVDVENFQTKPSAERQAELRQKLNINPDHKIIMSISRLVHKNGMDDLIAAMSYLSKDFKLVLIGQGSEYDVLKKLSQKLSVQDQVVFVQTVPHRELPEYLSLADVFVRPSRSEGLGNVFLEAMAAGVPVVATPAGGIVDFLEDKKTGIFCRVNDPQSIAMAVKLILNDASLRATIITNGRRLVQDKYNWSEIANKYRQLYIA